MKLSLRHKNGFTIVELLIVVAVIAILAAVAVVGYYGVQSNARDKSLLSDIEKVEAELTRYATKNGGLYDSALNWDSSSGANVNIRFTPSSGNTIVVQVVGDGYCIKAFNPASNSKNLASAARKGAGKIGCTSGWLELVAGGSQFCGIASNELAYCWGTGTSGQLGNGASVNSNIPVAVSTSGALAGKTIRSFAYHENASHMCVIASDNNAYCWGTGTSGQLGNGASVNSNIPVAVSTSGVLTGKTIKQLFAVANNTCAIASDNNLYCWGSGTSGRLGNGASVNSNIPVAVSTSGALAGKTIKSVSMGNGHTCVIASDSNVYCWGGNSNGQLGDGTITTSNIPVVVSRAGVLSGKTSRQISVTPTNTCILGSDNNVYCFGTGTSGQLGNGGSVSSSLPVLVSNTGVLAGKAVQSLHGGNGFFCVIASDSGVYCWGYGANGQLGNGSTASSNIPVAVTPSGVLSGKSVTTLMTEYSAASICAIASDENAYCWGWNNSGQLGNGNVINSSVPVTVAPSGALSGKKIKSVVMGGAATACAIASDDNAYCWGFGTGGQLGNGVSSSSSLPVMVTRPSGL